MMRWKSCQDALDILKRAMTSVVYLVVEKPINIVLICVVFAFHVATWFAAQHAPLSSNFAFTVACGVF